MVTDKLNVLIRRKKGSKQLYAPVIKIIHTLSCAYADKKTHINPPPCTAQQEENLSEVTSSCVSTRTIKACFFSDGVCSCLSCKTPLQPWGYSQLHSPVCRSPILKNSCLTKPSDHTPYHTGLQLPPPTGHILLKKQVVP